MFSHWDMIAAMPWWITALMIAIAVLAVVAVVILTQWRGMWRGMWHNRLTGQIFFSMALMVVLFFSVSYQPLIALPYDMRAGLEEQSTTSAAMPLVSDLSDGAIDFWKANAIFATAMVQKNSKDPDHWLSLARAMVVLKRWHDGVHAARIAVYVALNPSQVRAAQLLLALALQQDNPNVSDTVRKLLHSAGIADNIDPKDIRAQLME